MKKYTSERILEINENVLTGIGEDNLDYFEYNQIPIKNKLSFMTNKIKNIANCDKNITFYVFENNKVVSIWVISRDDFDSEIFGIDIYKIVNLVLLEPNIEKLDNIIDESLKHLQKVINVRKKLSYFLLGINTNSINATSLMNKLIGKSFHYIHTLLTFKMLREEYSSLYLSNNNNLLIRTVKESDLDDIVSLATNSFKYSRFHLDPFLNKDKANILLATSAINSIKNHFADIMFVAEKQNKVVGYYSGKKKYIPEFDLTFGEAIFSAVNEKYRGLGVFKELNSKLLEWFYNNTEIAEMGTYIANTPVHKTWNGNRLSIIRGVHQLAIIIKPSL